jgi:WD40 repeat protein
MDNIDLKTPNIPPQIEGVNDSEPGETLKETKTQIEGPEGATHTPTTTTSPASPTLPPPAKWYLPVEDNNTVTLYHPQTIRPVCELKGHTDRIVTLKSLSNGAIVTTALDNTIKTWTISHDGVPECKHSRNHNVPIHQWIELPNGNLALASNTKILIWTPTLQDVTEWLAHTKQVTALIVWGPYLVTGSMDITIRIWSLTTHELVKTHWGHMDGIRKLTVLNENRFLSSSLDGTIHIWDERTCIHFFHVGFPHAMTVASSGEIVYSNRIGSVYADNILQFKSYGGPITQLMELKSNSLLVVCPLAVTLWDGREGVTVPCPVRIVDIVEWNGVVYVAGTNRKVFALHDKNFQKQDFMGYLFQPISLQLHEKEEEGEDKMASRRCCCFWW